jgi:hypothetical protein
MALFPPIFASKGWYTASYIAHKLGRSPRTIQHWCKSGFFSRRGCVVVATTMGGRNLKMNGYWVYISPSMRTDAILSKITVDTPPLANLPSNRSQI